MSVMLFIDKSRWLPQGKKDTVETLAAVAFEEIKYDEFCRKLLRLKTKFFQRGGVGEFPIRGRSLLSARGLGSYRKIEFVRELLSLCRLQNAVSFSTTRVRIPERAENLPAEFKIRPGNNSTASDADGSDFCSPLLAYLIERVNSFMLEKHPGQMAKLVFRSEEVKKDRKICAAVMELFYKTPYGGGFSGILGSPLLVPATHSPGLQVADLFAYTVNQQHGGRYEVGSYFAEVETMQFISAFERDDYELRGMNVLDG